MALTDTTKFSPRTGRRIVTYVLTDGRSGTSSNTANTDPSAISVRTIKNGSVTPDYTSRLRKHLRLPVVDYSYRKIVDSGSYYVGAYVKSTQRAGYVETETTTGPGTTPGLATSYKSSDGAFTAQDNKLRNKINEKIKNQKVNLGQVAGERHQVIRMVGDNATRIAHALQSLKRGNLTGAARALGVSKPGRYARKRLDGTQVGIRADEWVSRAWLELQYGWRPLLSDIYGAAEALATLPTAAYIHRVTVSSTISDNQQSSTSSNLGQITYTSSHDVTRRRKYVVYFRTDPESKPLASLGLTNPTMVAWELLPWSFVIDWFLPIGNWINSWDATLGCQFDDGSSTTSLKVISITSETNRGVDKTYYTTQRLISDFTLERSRLLTFPSAALPEWKNPLSTEHALNALALLTQLGQRFRK